MVPSKSFASRQLRPDPHEEALSGEELARCQRDVRLLPYSHHPFAETSCCVCLVASGHLLETRPKLKSRPGLLLTGRDLSRAKRRTLKSSVPQFEILFHLPIRRERPYWDHGPKAFPSAPATPICSFSLNLQLSERGKHVRKIVLRRSTVGIGAINCGAGKSSNGASRQLPRTAALHHDACTLPSRLRKVLTRQP